MWSLSWKFMGNLRFDSLNFQLLFGSFPWSLPKEMTSFQEWAMGTWAWAEKRLEVEAQISSCVILSCWLISLCTNLVSLYALEMSKQGTSFLLKMEQSKLQVCVFYKKNKKPIIYTNWTDAVPSQNDFKESFAYNNNYRKKNLLWIPLKIDLLQNWQLLISIN